MSYPSALESFCEDGWITDILYVVKSGKEVTVYCCRAGPTTGGELCAAKIYRAHESRSFKNDAIYHEGRATLDQHLHRAHPDKRLQRAIKKKTAAGRQVQFASWIGHEFRTLSLLHTAGADVPKPLACADSAMLME